MSKKNKNKISYYSLEDINKIGVVDNINCNEKSVIGIIDHSMPYLLILCITTIIPISEGMSIIVFILLSILTFIFLYSRHAYDRFINFKLSINGKKIIYINEKGQVFNYNESDLLSAKYHHRYSLSGLSGDRIEINMSDKQTIWINKIDRNFYKLITYLEQKNLLET